MYYLFKSSFYVDNILKNFEQQIYTNKELILLMQAEDEEFEEIKSRLSSHENITLVRQLEHELLGFVFNKGVDIAKGYYIAKFDDDDLYGPHYLTDGILPFQYTKASVVGKTETFLYHEATDNYYLRFKGKRHRYLDFVMGATIIAKKRNIQ